MFENPIAIVDDSEIDIDFLVECIQLAKVNRKIEKFSSGEKFLDYMEGVLQGFNRIPCFVFLDVNMPDLNGFETLEKLRVHQEFESLPVVVFISNSDSPKDIDKAKRLNCQFVEKFLRVRDCVDYFSKLASELK